MPDSADDRLAKATAWLKKQQAVKKKGRLATAGEAVDRFLARAGLAKRVAQAGVIEDWPSLATAAWANELSLMAPSILARLNRDRVGRIREIRWIASGGQAYPKGPPRR
jgi:hypothetical protein